MSDPTIEEALAGLAGDAPDGLEDKVFTGWLAAPSRLGEVYVAFTGEGVQFVRSAESVGSDPGAFAEAYRDRFGRPLSPAARGPAGLAAALRAPVPGRGVRAAGAGTPPTPPRARRGPTPGGPRPTPVRPGPTATRSVRAVRAWIWAD